MKNYSQMIKYNLQETEIFRFSNNFRNSKISRYKCTILYSVVMLWKCGSPANSALPIIQDVSSFFLFCLLRLIFCPLIHGFSFTCSVCEVLIFLVGTVCYLEMIE
uniref:Uncharacterized protein n=1 Tax=Cacopsylla melanoneura TaxID=428564 RepID=A0A8D9A9B2_9HEMI